MDKKQIATSECVGTKGAQCGASLMATCDGGGDNHNNNNQRNVLISRLRWVKHVHGGDEKYIQNFSQKT
jgi:hypothetical protein